MEQKAVSKIYLLNGILLLALFSFSLAVFDRLPAQIPVHFGQDGIPNRWASATLLNWLAVPLIALGLNALMYGIRYLVWRLRSRPQFINVSLWYQKQFLELPREKQEPIIRLMASITVYIAVPLNILFCWIQLATYQVAMEEASTVPAGEPVFFVVGAVFAIIIIVLYQSNKMLKRAIAEAGPRPEASPLREPWVKK